MRQFETESLPEAAYTVESFGRGLYLEYRIPGIVVTENGTVICCYEGRMDTHNDWAQIDILVCRSTDGGETFARQVIAGSAGVLDDAGKKESNAASDRVLDAASDKASDKALDAASNKTLHKTPEQQESVTWNNPVLIQDGELVHLLFHKNYETAYYCFSDDDGITFSEPVEITTAFREFPWEWNVCASGPGHGIVTKTGRLLVPVWLACGEPLDGDGRKKTHQPSVAGAVYSDDRGKTWHAGALVNGISNANETTLAERADGSILFNFRNHEAEGCRALGISPDGVSGFGKIWKETGLPDPKCFGSMVRMPDGRIGFINCSNSDKGHPLGERIFLTYYLSDDDGEHWKPSVFVDTYGGYADVAAGGEWLYVFYEQSVWKEELKRVNHLILKRYRL